eukprot:TRINITY_DN8254_c0_g1::TRINITY_DN8254_c0_g1_i1::g.10267::m.10267 TRINITY_DN8254_c0_g1::TRINITY_DN8254_c0_g1_i1::g.10267  ORF type:complete len:281 (+),score=36.90,sp/Q15024/EXOS7_HUMAN/41.96/2e-73,RNase_PH/PF01138.16/1.4e-19,RNase_PH/PF01138.16/4.5e+03,RNase_PH_C/PF03725.10/5.9e-10 TRINITY_DN8254_c0_g1_i1:71-913(+)
MICSSEQRYILEGIEDNLRVDGRGRLDYGCITLETGVAGQADGSCRIRLRETDVLVGIKLDIAEPLPQAPNCGRIEFTVECSGIAGKDFENTGSEIARFLADAYRTPSALDLTKLIIVPSKHCWLVYVDVVIFSVDGNLMDAVAIGVKAALSDVKVPSVAVQMSESGDVELEMDDDPSACTSLSLRTVPLCVTLCQIGSKYVVDCTLDEEACMSAGVSVAVNGDGNICALHKVGAGSLDPAAIPAMTAAARKVGLSLLKNLDAALTRLSTSTTRKVGFFG